MKFKNIQDIEGNVFSVHLQTISMVHNMGNYDRGPICRIHIHGLPLTVFGTREEVVQFLEGDETVPQPTAASLLVQ